MLLLEVLPGTQGIYGFLVAFIVLLQTGIIGGEAVEVTMAQGWEVFFICLAIALTGLFSGWFQGKVGVSGLNILAKRPEKFGNAVILSAMVETYALLGLVVSILSVLFLKLG